MTVFYFLLALIPTALLALAVGLSYAITRRQDSGERHSPAEQGLTFETVSFLAPDGVTLAGWYLPAAGSDRAVVLMHGHSTGMDLDIHHAAVLLQAGFNVLMFDHRGHARSGGRTITFGYLERQDARSAVTFLKQRGQRRVGLLGFSLGGMVALLAAPLCPEVDAVIDDGGPVRIYRALAVRAGELGAPHWLQRPLAWLALAGASLRVGANLFAYEPVRWVSQVAPRPLLIIHGELDQYLPDFADLVQAAPFAQVWRVPDVGHVQACNVYTEEWNRRVIKFLEKSMP